MAHHFLLLISDRVQVCKHHTHHPMGSLCKEFITIFCVAFLISSCTGTKVAGPNCTVVAAPCDNNWHSGQNQTFAFYGIAPPNLVQLFSYWGNSKGCIAHAASAAGVTLSWSTCASSVSQWTYGPGAIQTYVYYNNTEGMCLSLRPNATTPSEPTLGFAPCCGNAGQSCTAVELQMQMWLEPPTSKNPYSRIFSQYENNGVALCLTRIGSDCA